MKVTKSGCESTDLATVRIFENEQGLWVGVLLKPKPLVVVDPGSWKLSIKRFHSELLKLPARAALSRDLYVMFETWWSANEVGQAPTIRNLVLELSKLGAALARKRYEERGKLIGPHGLVLLDAGLLHAQAPVIGAAVMQFRETLAEYRGRTREST